MSIFRQVKLDFNRKNLFNFVEKDYDIRKTEVAAYVGNFPRILIEYIAIILIALVVFFDLKKYL